MTIFGTSLALSVAIVPKTKQKPEVMSLKKAMIYFIDAITAE
jgi:hypothetical protein